MKVFRYLLRKYCIVPHAGLLVIGLVVGSAVGAAEKTTTIAILPFENQAGDQYGWLSAGISDTLIAKFTGTKGLRVVEREKLAELANVKFSKELATQSDREANAIFNDELKGEGHSSRRGAESTEEVSFSESSQRTSSKSSTVSTKELSLLGAEYLLVGSYTVLGEQIRINARIVHAETAKVNGDTVLTVRGDVEDIFVLQTQLAEKFAKACNLEVAHNKLSYTEGQSPLSYEIFNRGKVLYAEGQYSASVDAFIKAQQQNDGFYFAEAHTWEGKARIALANSTKDQSTKLKVQQAHVAKFEKDAAEAAPAFYDLGVALQACGQYKKAIKAYDDYLRWMSDSKKTILWSRQLQGHPIGFNITGGYKVNHHDIENNKYTRYSLVNDGRLLIPAKQYDRKTKVSTLTLGCYDLNTGEELWAFSDKSKKKSHTVDRGIAAGKEIYVVQKDKLFIIDKLTGDPISHVTLRHPEFSVFNKTRVFVSRGGTSGIVYSVGIDKQNGIRQIVAWFFKQDESGGLKSDVVYEGEREANVWSVHVIPICFQRGDSLLINPLGFRRGKVVDLTKMVRIDLRTGKVFCELSDEEIKDSIGRQSIELSELLFGAVTPSLFYEYDARRKRIIIRDRESREELLTMDGYKPYQGYGRLIEKGGYLYLVANGFVHKLRLRDQKLLWQFKLKPGDRLGGVTNSGPVVYNHTNKTISAINDQLISPSQHKQAYAYYYSGICRMKAGEYKAAITDLEKSLSLFPSLNDSFYQLSVAYSKLARNHDNIHKQLLNADRYYLEEDDDAGKRAYIKDTLLRYGNISKKSVEVEPADTDLKTICVAGEVVSEGRNSRNQTISMYYDPSNSDICDVWDGFDFKGGALKEWPMIYMKNDAVYCVYRWEGALKLRKYSMTSRTVVSDISISNVLGTQCVPHMNTMVLGDGKLLYMANGSSMSELRAVDLETGKELWRQQVLPGYYRICVSDKKVLLFEESNPDGKRLRLLMFNENDGCLMWQKDVPPDFNNRGDLLFAGRYILYSGRYLWRTFIIDSQTGETRSFDCKYDEVEFNVLKKGQTAIISYWNIKCRCHGKKNYPHKIKGGYQYGVERSLCVDLTSGEVLSKHNKGVLERNSVELVDNISATYKAGMIRFVDSRTGNPLKRLQLSRPYFDCIRLARAKGRLHLLSNEHYNLDGAHVVKCYEFASNHIPDYWAEQIVEHAK